MSLIQIQPWEVRLLNVATEAFNTPASSARLHTDAKVLARAYDVCEQITRQHSKTFFIASGLLPYEKRRAARALYAFCRITDDIVDQASQSSDRLGILKNWQQRISSDTPPASDSVCLAWADTRARFHIPHGYAHQLIEGVARDIFKTRYASFDELAEYSYGVASTVGLMAMHIIGFDGPDAIPYAVRLGVALQVTNILRDVGEDYRNGRIYLPQDELTQAGLGEDDIRSGIVTPRWRDFMKFQIHRNRSLYAESIAGVAKLHPNGRFAITAAARLYEAILDDIEAADYDVFSRRAHVSAIRKARRLPGIWWYSRHIAQVH